MKDTLQERATNVIKPLIPPDAEERVQRAFKQWNQIVRDHIRGATGLKLAEGDSRFAIPVKIVEGFPETLAQLIDAHHDPVLWRLILGQPKLGSLVEGAGFLIEAWEEIEKWPKLPAKIRNGRRALERSLKIGITLQNLAVAERVRKEIKKIREDILGVYRYSISSDASSVELYWIPICMVAAMLDVRIEDLTLVVLIHELAHGYTHLGRDIDGGSWSSAAFARSCAEVKEGLAQFYAHVVTELMAARVPGPKLAYEQFLTMQSGPYLVHQDWIKKEQERRGEIVRYTMIAARSQGPVDYPTWKRLMSKTRRSLAKSSTTTPIKTVSDGLFDSTYA